MPAVAPPFPVTASPHVDLEIRELYRRIGTIERILRTSAPARTSEPVSVTVLNAGVLYCSMGSVGFDHGWIGTRTKLRRHPARQLATLHGPAIVLGITAYISEVFVSGGTGRPVSPYSRLLICDILPEEEPLPSRPEYWGDISEDNLSGRYVTAPLVIDLKARMPTDILQYWYNVRRKQTGGRQSLGRPIDTLAYLPLVAGFTFGDPTVVAGDGQVADVLGWPDDARGEVTLAVVWIDDREPRLIKPLEGRPALFAVKPVKVGPR